MNRSIKVLSIAAYYFFPPLSGNFSISKKWLVFGGDPILEPIFDFCERSEPDLHHPSESTSNQKEQCPENTSAVKHPIWAFPNIFLRHEAERCHEEE